MRSKIVGIICFQILALSFAASAAVSADASVLSFKEWKTDKSTEVRTRYSKLETEYLAKKAANPRDSILKSLYSDLKSMKSHVDEVGELAVSDYFVGYLSRFKDQKKAFQSAAEKLDSSEVAELMNAYADSLLKTSGEGISTNFQGPTTEASK